MRTQQAWLNLPGGSKQQQRDRQRTWKHKYGGGRAEAQAHPLAGAMPPEAMFYRPYPRDVVPRGWSYTRYNEDLAALPLCGDFEMDVTFGVGRSMPSLKESIEASRDISQRLLELAKERCDAAGYVTDRWSTSPVWCSLLDTCCVQFRFHCPCGKPQDLVARWPLAGIQRDAPERQLGIWAEEIKLELDKHVAGEA